MSVIEQNIDEELHAACVLIECLMKRRQVST